MDKLLADPKRGPGQQTRAMVRGYAAGVNNYLRRIGGTDHVGDRACRGRSFVRADVTSLDIWRAIYAANLLASAGGVRPADRRRGAAVRHEPDRRCAAAARFGGLRHTSR